jgi:tetratricopeptide (TPR) repeat protein
VRIVSLARAAFTLAIALPAICADGITVDYPGQGSQFPPEFPAPTFLFRDAVPAASYWRVTVVFADGSPALHSSTRGERLQLRPIDPRVAADTNEPPKLTPLQAAAHTWIPDVATWSALKKHSAEGPATVTFEGVAAQDSTRVISSGQVKIYTSRDPVGAPIFYRDVPLIPFEGGRGVIMALPLFAIPLIEWRLRDVSETSSHLLLSKMPTCANCHSFARDGKTMGMDLDGPRNDKGLYALVDVKSQMTIRDDNVIKWATASGRQPDGSPPTKRFGFMSQVSPDGQYVITSVDAPNSGSKGVIDRFFNAAYKDYAFGQVFYPTRGILAWYSRASGKLLPLPGADDPRYVHAGAVWSPDGKYLVFLRGQAREPYDKDSKPALVANDPNETFLQYDLYRIPFNDGKGGKAEPVAGASNNGKSNSFAKISPNGRWIVYVQARNGLLMRPDSELYIVPAEGGVSRRLTCNEAPMNSWHSWSPNSRWLVFSSKRRSPYTQMYLTHIDENGQDSPAIIIDNTTASNRAVNIPEFVNIGAEKIEKLDVPAADYYRHSDNARDLAQKGDAEGAIGEWRKALALSPEDDKAHNALGILLTETGKYREAIEQFQKALAVTPDYPDVHSNLGVALAGMGKTPEAIAEFQRALEINPNSVEAHTFLGRVLAQQGKYPEAIDQFSKALQTKSDYAPALAAMGRAQVSLGKGDEAISTLRKALEVSPDSPEIRTTLGLTLVAKGDLAEALVQFKRVVEIDPNYPKGHYNLGRDLVGLGQFDQALAELQKALTAEPNSAEVLTALGTALMPLRRSDEGIAQFEKAIAAEPSYADAHYYLGAAYFYAKGRPADGLAQWRKVIELDPDNLEVLTQTAWTLATSGNPSLRNGKEAVGYSERAVTITRGQEPVPLFVLAASLAEAGRFPDAVDAGKRALALATARKDQRLIDGLNTQIPLYQSGRAFHESR